MIPTPPARTNANALTCLEKREYTQTIYYMRITNAVTKIRAIEQNKSDADFTPKERERMRSLIDVAFAAKDIQPLALGKKVEDQSLKMRKK